MRQAGTFGRLCRVLTAICLLALTAGAAHAEGAQTEMFDRNTPIQTVLDDPAFGDYGRLLFPVDAGYFSGNTLGNLRLTWYSHIDPDETVEIVNTLRNRVLNGEIIFYDIYTEAEKAADPDKRDTGLFFFKGTPGAKFAVCNAGGGFAYVGAMHDSFPHALELSKKGYNAFALIYRPGAQTACEDLARAHLCLRGRQRRHCQLAADAAAAGAAQQIGYAHGVSRLSGTGARFRSGYRHSGGGLAERRGGLLGKSDKVRIGT